MNRRALLIVGFALATIPSRVGAQKPLPRPRIGLLWIASGGESVELTAFIEGLRDQGYIDGKNIEVITRSLVDRYDQLPEAARRLVDERVDVIVTYGTTATLAAAKATSTIPIVLVEVSDPVRIGVAASLSKPARNVTGVSSVSTELTGKRLEILKEAVPGIRRVGVLYNPLSATESTVYTLWEGAGRTLNLDVQGVVIRTASEIDGVIGGLTRQGLDALAVTTSTMFVANRKQIVAAITKTRLPALYSNADYIDAGGLIAYGANRAHGFRRAADYVSRILKGAKPADMAIEQPTKFELAVNLRTAQALGIAIPHSILLRADTVIE